MPDNKKYVELLWAEKYDKYEKGEKIPIEKPNLPFQVVETVNKPRIKGGYTIALFPEDAYPQNYPHDWKNKPKLCTSRRGEVLKPLVALRKVILNHSKGDF
jgi:adenine-specific DNA-methyltransferase